MKKTIGSIILLAFLLWESGVGPAPAQQMDPQLQKIMETIKSDMPGVSYEILKGAKAEGKLMFYHLSLPNAMPRLIQEFEKRFPFVKVQEYFASGGPLFQKFSSEARARKNVADIWEHTEIGAMNKLADEGLLMKYKIANDAEYPDAFKRSGFWYPFCYAQVVVAWNKDLVPDGEAVKRFKTWEGLLDPYWKGKSLATIIIQSGGTTQVTYYMLHEKFGIDFWKKLAALQPKQYEAVNPLADAVGSGEVALAWMGSEAGFYNKYDRGAPVHWTNPNPRVAVPYGQAIAKDAPHPNAAKLFQEFIFSKVGQTIMATIQLPSFTMGDLRKHAKEPWYSLPPVYKYDMEKVYKSMRGPNSLVDQWNKIFRK